jgi:hypothetical protein
MYSNNIHAGSQTKSDDADHCNNKATEKSPLVHIQLELAHDDVDPASVGLSPQYWCYTPMLIAEVNELVLRNGIDCIPVVVDSLPLLEEQQLSLTRIVTTEDNDNRAPAPSSGHNQQTSSDECEVMIDKPHMIENKKMMVHLVPVSCCELQGFIVAAEYKSNGSKSYVLDDGTGLVDCLSSTETDDGTDADAPPPVRESEADDIKNRPKNDPVPIDVGDHVRLRGRICVLSVSQSKPNGIHDANREIHITSIDRVPLSGGDEESWHSIQCIKRHRIWVNTFQQDTYYYYYQIDNKNKTPAHPGPILNAPVALARLSHSTILPISHHEGGLHRDSDSRCSTTMRTLQYQCPCDAYPRLKRHKEELLYCHCTAKPEALDPHFVYRDALLHRLLRMESKVIYPQNPTVAEKDDNKQSSTTPAKPPSSTKGVLIFQYNTLGEDYKLRRVAEQVIAANGSNCVNNSNNHQRLAEIQHTRLLRNTVRALKNDGLLFLLDEHQDDYILLSAKRAIRPFLLLQQQRSSSTSGSLQLPGNNPPPTY